MKLEEFPKGFHLDGIGYTCAICGGSASNENSWFDKYGIKCMICQKAVDRKEIPPSIAKKKDSWYSKTDLEIFFNIKGPAVRRLIKQGVLKARNLTTDGRQIHHQLFLIKDNKETLHPKKLLKTQMVKEITNGQEWYAWKPWYMFVDPHEHLKGYKIMNYLEVLYS
jgi:hypothetical protein